MSAWRRALLVLAILFVCVSCDQVTKNLATEHLAQRGTMDFAGSTLRLQYAENRGAFLGLCDSLPGSARKLFLSYATGLFLASFLIYLLRARSMNRWSLCACALLCGGGIGNLIDRLARDGYVVDFLNCGIGGFRTGIFNVADMAITAGALWLAARSALGWRLPQRRAP